MIGGCCLRSDRDDTSACGWMPSGGETPGFDSMKEPRDSMQLTSYWDGFRGSNGVNLGKSASPIGVFFFGEAKACGRTMRSHGVASPSPRDEISLDLPNCRSHLNLNLPAPVKEWLVYVHPPMVCSPKFPSAFGAAGGWEFEHQ